MVACDPDWVRPHRRLGAGEVGRHRPNAGAVQKPVDDLCLGKFDHVYLAASGLRDPLDRGRITEKSRSQVNSARAAEVRHDDGIERVASAGGVWFDRPSTGWLTQQGAIGSGLEQEEVTVEVEFEANLSFIPGVMWFAIQPGSDDELSHVHRRNVNDEFRALVQTLYGRVAANACVARVWDKALSGKRGRACVGSRCWCRTGLSRLPVRDGARRIHINVVAVDVSGGRYRRGRVRHVGGAQCNRFLALRPVATRLRAIAALADATFARVILGACDDPIRASTGVYVGLRRTAEQGQEQRNELKFPVSIGSWK
jgi:hypothetical protein